MLEVQMTLDSEFAGTSGATYITSELSCERDKISSSIETSWLELNEGMW